MQKFAKILPALESDILCLVNLILIAWIGDITNHLIFAR